MTVTILGPAHPLRGGGISTFNERLAQVLGEAGHRVVIESFSLQYPGFLFPGKSQTTAEPPPPGLTIRSDINSIAPLNWLRVGRRIRRERPDLLIVRYWLPFMGPCFGTILRQVRKNRHTRILCIADNIVPHEKRPGDAAFTRYFLKPVDAFVTMSREVLKDLQAVTDKPAAYTPHPLYDSYGQTMPPAEARASLGLPVSGKYALFFGFIRGYKGLDLLLEAMGDARIRAAGIRLIVAGEFYGDRVPYDAIIEQHGLADRLHLFTEFIPNSDIRRYFSAADLVVQPYRSATQSGITGIAYHFEKPMVVTNVGGLAEAVPDGKVGYVVPPDPAAIAEAVLQFFADPQTAARMQSGLREEKMRFSWDAFVDMLMETAGM